jgi:hypothetical protein
MRGDLTKYLFIDSSVRHGRVSLPTQPFNCTGNDQMSFTLLDFQMRRSFPAVNNTNNIFYIYDKSTQTNYECVLDYGDYDFNTMKTELNAAFARVIAHTDNTSLASKLTSITVDFIPGERQYTFTLAMIVGNSEEDIEIRCYHVKDGFIPTGISKQGAFSDSFELLGAEPLMNGNEEMNSLLRDPKDVARLISYLPASLSTLDSIYLRMNLELGNYESPGLDVYHKNGVQMQNSSVIARIRVEDSESSTKKVHEQISFRDSGGDMYQKMLPLKNLEHLQFFVTDKRNRSLAEYDGSQSRLGLMAFSLTLRWDKFVQQTKDINQIPTRPPPTPFLPSYGYNMPRI